ncbi:hypothetical protein [Photorhabdus stackebrandtii]|nr:hypothetical protein [Photorhabdus stackebrandtii]
MTEFKLLCKPPENRPVFWWFTHSQGRCAEESVMWFEKGHLLRVTTTIGKNVQSRNMVIGFIMIGHLRALRHNKLPLPDTADGVEMAVCFSGDGD